MYIVDDYLDGSITIYQERKMNQIFYFREDIEKMLNVKKSKAYRVIQILNEELKNNKYHVKNGCVSIKYYKERIEDKKELGGINMKKSFYYVEDVMEMLRLKNAAAYRVMQRLNEELEAQGKMVQKGRVSVAYFNEKFYIN